VCSRIGEPGEQAGEHDRNTDRGTKQPARSSIIQLSFIPYLTAGTACFASALSDKALDLPTDSPLNNSYAELVFA
jgi:hypothetical protein